MFTYEEPIPERTSSPRWLQETAVGLGTLSRWLAVIVWAFPAPEHCLAHGSVARTIGALRSQFVVC